MIINITWNKRSCKVIIILCITHVRIISGCSFLDCSRYTPRDCISISSTSRTSLSLDKSLILSNLQFLSIYYTCTLRTGLVPEIKIDKSHMNIYHHYLLEVISLILKSVLWSEQARRHVFLVEAKAG